MDSCVQYSPPGVVGSRFPECGWAASVSGGRDAIGPALSPLGSRTSSLGLGVWRGVPVAVLVLALFTATGCGRRETLVDRGNRDQVLYIGNGTEPKGLDPHLVTGVTEGNIMAALFEGLVNEDPVDLHPVPGVAERWDVSDDGKVYTFHLRGNARWSNGDPVSAADFVYSYQRMLTPTLAAEYAYMLHCLKNGKAYNTGTLTDFAQVGVKAKDAMTLVLELENPVPYFLSLLNHYSWWPVHPPTVERFGGMADRSGMWTRPENFVGNGPFSLKVWQISRRIIVEKNPTYWNAAVVRLKQIHFLPIDSADTEERAFRDGALHVTSTVPLHRIEDYRTRHPDLIRFDPYLGTYFYRLNAAKPPLNDKRVRRALALVIDRGQIAQFILKAGQRPALCFTPPNTAGYSCRVQFEGTADEARKLLIEAGYPGGKGFPTVELLYNTSEAHRVIAEAIQQMWKKELGVDVKLVNQEWKVYLDSVKRLEYQIARAAWIGDYNDPNTFLDMWVTDGGNNRTGWSNAEYDRLIDLAGRTADPVRRFEYFQQAEAILLDELPIIPIYFYVRSVLMQPSVRNWNPTILDHHPYAHVYLEATK